MKRIFIVIITMLSILPCINLKKTYAIGLDEILINDVNNALDTGGQGFADLTSYIINSVIDKTSGSARMPLTTFVQGSRVIQYYDTELNAHQFSYNIACYLIGNATGLDILTGLTWEYYDKATGKSYLPNCVYITYLDDMSTTHHYIVDCRNSGISSSGSYSGTTQYISITASSNSVVKDVENQRQFNSTVPVTYYFDTVSPYNYIFNINTDFFSSLSEPYQFYGWRNVDVYDSLYPVENIWDFTTKVKIKNGNSTNEIQLSRYNACHMQIDSCLTNKTETQNTIKNSPIIKKYYVNDLFSYNTSYSHDYYTNNQQTVINNINNIYPPKNPSYNVPDDYKEWGEDDILFTLPKLEIPTETLPQNVLENSGALLQKALDVFDVMGITSIIFVCAVISIVAMFLIK